MWWSSKNTPCQCKWWMVAKQTDSRRINDPGTIIPACYGICCFVFPSFFSGWRIVDYLVMDHLGYRICLYIEFAYMYIVNTHIHQYQGKLSSCKVISVDGGFIQYGHCDLNF